MNAHAERGMLLLNQDRADLAEKEFYQGLVHDPGDYQCHSGLAWCLACRKQHKQALMEADQAVSLAPDWAMAHYFRALVLNAMERAADAIHSIKEAIRLDPIEAEFYGLHAMLLLQQAKWQEALKSAEAGLQHNAENEHCLNSRAVALTHMGRMKDVDNSLECTLQKNPENAFAHAARGWALLHQNNPKLALESFQTALQLEPGLEYARSGLAEALKARYFVYRIMLNYFLWMSRLNSGVKWGIIIGGVIAAKFLRNCMSSNPSLTPILMPLLVLYFAFVGLTWIADPLFNLVLRMNKYGRHALSQRARIGSNCFGTLLALGIITIPTAFLIDSASLVLFGFVCLAMLIPAGSVFQPERKRNRIILGAYSIGLMLIGAILVMTTAMRGLSHPLSDTFSYLFLYAWVGYTWFCSFMQNK